MSLHIGQRPDAAGRDAGRALFRERTPVDRPLATRPGPRSARSEGHRPVAGQEAEEGRDLRTTEVHADCGVIGTDLDPGGEGTTGVDPFQGVASRRKRQLRRVLVSCAELLARRCWGRRPRRVRVGRPRLVFVRWACTSPGARVTSRSPGPHASQAGNARLTLTEFHTSRYIGGLTHGFYRYPATTSPDVARELLLSHTDADDLVLDPFMGGGTTIVESRAHGRRAVGCDLNSLAVFVTRAKTTPLTEGEWDVLGFSDLCRFARRQRQIVISTHERRFASLLERKLASRLPDERIKVLRFMAWDRRGPSIEAADIPAEIDVGEMRLTAVNG
jgi:hypothetical protein